MKIEFYDFGEIENDKLKYAVIVSRHKNKLILVRHEERTTWEIPGGRREPNEEIFDTAKRELQEETGAKEFIIEKVTIYSVEQNGEKSYGGLFYAEIKVFESLNYEIEEIKEFDFLPENLTYKEIQPKLLKKVEEWEEKCQ